MPVKINSVNKKKNPFYMEKVLKRVPITSSRAGRPSF